MWDIRCECRICSMFYDKCWKNNKKNHKSQPRISGGGEEETSPRVKGQRLLKITTEKRLKASDEDSGVLHSICGTGSICGPHAPSLGFLSFLRTFHLHKMKAINLWP